MYIRIIRSREGGYCFLFLEQLYYIYPANIQNDKLKNGSSVSNYTRCLVRVRVNLVWPF
jgi:hypothetical protein